VVTVLVGGREAARQPITAPEFEIPVDLPPGSGRVRIDLRVSPLRELAEPDTRRVGLLLQSIGFQP
jgi:hypothetical protein